MNRPSCFALLLCFSLALAGQESRKPISNNDVLAMNKSGLSEQTIVPAHQNGPTNFGISRQPCTPAGDGSFNVKICGAKGDGVTDDTGALQNAFSSAAGIGSFGGTVVIPPGRYIVTKTLSFENTFGLRFVGSGGATQFVWRGNGTDPMFLLAGVEESEFSGFMIQAYSAQTPLKTAIQLVTHATASNGSQGWVATMNTFRKITIGSIVNGIVIGAPDGTPNMVDANNDFHRFIDVDVNSFTGNGFTIYNSQAYNEVFENCKSMGWGTGKYGLQLFGGNFTWRGGAAGGNLVDFDIQYPTELPDVIEGANFEGSKQFLHTGGPAANSFSIIISRNRIAADSQDPFKPVMEIYYPGPHRIIDNTIGTGDYSANLYFKIWVGVQQHLEFSRNIIRTSNSTWPTIFPGGSLLPTTHQDNVLDTASGNVRLD